MNNDHYFNRVDQANKGYIWEPSKNLIYLYSHKPCYKGIEIHK